MGELPPLRGVAVKSTLCPEQMEVEEAKMDTEGVTVFSVTLTGVLALSHPPTVWLT